MIAFSFPAWKCAGCHQIVEWADAICCEEDGKLYEIRHKDCPDG
jgi:hypothetical protein